MIKSAKRCLKKVIGKNCLIYDELLTLILEVEAVLNSRPLTYASSEYVEEPLTPACWSPGAWPESGCFFLFFLGGETIIINMMNEMIVQDEIINKIVVEWSVRTVKQLLGRFDTQRVHDRSCWGCCMRWPRLLTRGTITPNGAWNWNRWKWEYLLELWELHRLNVNKGSALLTAKLSLYKPNCEEEIQMATREVNLSVNK